MAATKDDDKTKAGDKAEKETGDKGGEDPNVDEDARMASNLRQATNSEGEPVASNVYSDPLADPATKAHNDARRNSAVLRFGPDAVQDPDAPSMTPFAQPGDDIPDLNPHTISPPSPIASQQPPMSLASDAPAPAPKKS